MSYKYQTLHVLQCQTYILPDTNKNKNYHYITGTESPKAPFPFFVAARAIKQSPYQIRRRGPCHSKTKVARGSRRMPPPDAACYPFSNHNHFYVRCPCHSPLHLCRQGDCRISATASRASHRLRVGTCFPRRRAPWAAERIADTVLAMPFSCTGKTACTAKCGAGCRRIHSVADRHVTSLPRPTRHCHTQCIKYYFFIFGLVVFPFPLPAHHCGQSHSQVFVVCGQQSSYLNNTSTGQIT